MLERPIIPLLAAAALLFAGTAFAEPVFPPGSRIGLEPPPGMSVSKAHAGFEDPDRKVNITILDLPYAAYEKIEKDLFTPPPEQQKNLTIEKRESFPFHDGIGFLASARAQIQGVAMRRWFFLAKAIAGPSGPVTAFITVDVPDSAAKTYPEAAIRKSLATVSFRAPPIEEQLSMLPFKLDELSGFRVLKVAPGGVQLIDGPTDDLDRHAYMIIAIGPGGPKNPSERTAFARDMLQAAPMKDMNITFGESMRINGLPGFEIRAEGKDPNGTAMTLVQWVRFGSSAFLRVIGVSRKDQWDTMFPRFRAVRDGVQPRG